MGSQIRAACVVCGGTASDHHHYRADNPAQGKGAGGTHEHLDTMSLCRRHHSVVLERGRWERGGFVPDPSGDFVRCTSRNGRVLAVRPLEPIALRVQDWDPLYAQSLETLERLALRTDDDDLIQLWGRADGLMHNLRLWQGLIAYALYIHKGRRYGGRWYALAAQDIYDKTGVSVSHSVVYARLKDYMVARCSDDPERTIALLGPTVSGAVAKARDIPAALCAAEEMLLAGTPKMQVAREMAKLSDSDNLPAPQPPCAVNGIHICKMCFQRGRFVLDGSSAGL